jgi:hypothetical protein
MSNTETNKRASNSNSRFLGNKSDEQKSDEEAMANLVNFMETLIQMDMQQKELEKLTNSNTEELTK